MKISKKPRRVTTNQLLDAMLQFQEAFMLGFENVNKRFDQIDTRFDRMESRDFDRRLDRLERRVDAIENHA